MAEVILKNICKSYDNGFNAVKNVNIDIEDKEFVVLVGPSGCGKSTTLRSKSYIPSKVAVILT